MSDINLEMNAIQKLKVCDKLYSSYWIVDRLLQKKAFRQYLKDCGKYDVINDAVAEIYDLWYNMNEEASKEASMEEIEEYKEWVKYYNCSEAL